MLNMNEFVQYAPIILIVVIFLLQQKFFVTPVEMERKHREIAEECNTKYASKDTVNELKEDLDDIKKKLQALCERILGV